MEAEMKTYECTSNWSRYNKGDVVEHWLWKKFPAEVQQKHFKERSVRVTRETAEAKASTLASKPAKLDKPETV